MTTGQLRNRTARPRLWAAIAVFAATVAAAQPAAAMPAESIDMTPPPAAPVAPVAPVAYHMPRSAMGMASWYGGRHAGRRTASGEIHSTHLRTAAHRSLPLGTVVRVTNLKNGKDSVVRINDRGPYAGGRLIDLSEQAARDLSMLNDGVVPVRVTVLAED